MRGYSGSEQLTCARLERWSRCALILVLAFCLGCEANAYSGSNDLQRRFRTEYKVVVANDKP